MPDQNLLELLEIYTDHMERQSDLVIQLLERIRKLETDLQHYKNMDHFDWSEQPVLSETEP